MTEWRIKTSSGEKGPFTGVKLLELAKARRIDAHTLVCHDSVTLGKHVEACTIPQIKAVFDSLAANEPEKHPEDVLVEKGKAAFTSGRNAIGSAINGARSLIPKRPKPPKVAAIRERSTPFEHSEIKSKPVPLPESVAAALFSPDPIPKPQTPIPQPTHLVHSQTVQVIHVASGQPAGYRCPYCQSTRMPIRRSKVSTGGWVFFWLTLLFLCIPLCWIGLLIRDSFKVCPACGMKLG